ncbi:N-terminal region of Chorein or VPS13 [Halocaridina rubra]|uniref:N-terminal region of Chorein or VPS13 n=1 Tax=Halocaridina rubra TaxID=373956 RepID=A0AAN8WPS6_HALRR
MAGLIKNQILKHLSKFAKNVSADSVNVSTLKGEGELNNLELNETVLTDLLELPTWLRITRAQVNRVNLKIQWTKLKNVPILVTLDEVLVEMETLAELRSQTSSTPLPSYSSGGKYGFTDKVIDGMTVTVNSVLITFCSHAFHATFQLSRIVLDSKNPNWQKSDLRMTRLKEPERGELLIFKELTWQTLRVEARSTRDQTLTPLRLITNQARCRITIKKKMFDCSVVACRLVLLMDDLLWVLTDSQLTAAFHFLDSLSDLVRKATQQSQKTKAIRKLESLPEFQAQQAQQARGTGMAAGSGGQQPRGAARPTPPQSNVTKVFSKYDVPETSYHFYSERIDLHFCDDPGQEIWLGFRQLCLRMCFRRVIMVLNCGRLSRSSTMLDSGGDGPAFKFPAAGRSSHPELSMGAALQVTVSQLELDFYPYHLASGDRTHWVKYTECAISQWAQAALAEFKTKLVDTLNSSRSSHTPLARAPPHMYQEPQQQGSPQLLILLYITLSPASSSVTPLTLMSSLTTSINLLFGLPLSLLPGRSILSSLLSTYSSSLLITCPFHLSLCG